MYICECVCVCIWSDVCVCVGGITYLSLEFSEIDLFHLHLTSGCGCPVSAELRVSYQSITPSIKNFTSRIESFWMWMG